ncbi:fungal-specific transcription factor domain-containing protein, partial [Bipolaris maydis]
MPSDGTTGPSPASTSSQTGSIVPQKRTADAAHGRQRMVKVTRACDVCKARKSKCSGGQPCDSCTRRRLPCQYEATYTRGKRATLDAPDPAAGPSPRGNMPQRSTPQPRHQAAVIMPDARLAVAQSTNDAEPPSRASPGLEVAGQYSDTTSGLSFLHRAWRRISNKEGAQLVNGQLGIAEDSQLLMSAGDKPFRQIGQMQMPSSEHSHALLDLYFDVCIATYRLLHRQTVEAWLTCVLENAESNLALSNGIGRAKTAVVLSVLAIASFHEEKAKGDIASSPENELTVEPQSEPFFAEATRLTASETGIPQLESAQCRLIQVLYLLMSCRFNQAWYVFGHALQIIAALGLHRRDDRKRSASATKRDYIEQQCRKRTFWVAYILDKYLGVIFGRPRHYHDDDIDQDFPDAVNDENMTSDGPRNSSSDDCHLESLICHARLAQIAEQISREVYSIKPIPNHFRLAASHRLGAALREWKSSLPPFLGSVNPSSLIPTFRRQSTALKLSYCHAVMLAHRPFLLKNTLRDNDSMQDLAKDSLRECILAARSVLDAVDRVAREGRMFHAFWWTHYVCFCALLVVYVSTIQDTYRNSMSVDDRQSMLDQAENCLQHLARATASNSPSRRYSIILQELRAEAKRKTAVPAQDYITPSSAVTVAGNPMILPVEVVNGSDSSNPTLQMWQPLFGSPMNMTTPGLQDFLDDWQTTDWLDLDSSAFGPFPDMDGGCYLG